MRDEKIMSFIDQMTPEAKVAYFALEVITDYALWKIYRKYGWRTALLAHVAVSATGIQVYLRRKNIEITLDGLRRR